MSISKLSYFLYGVCELTVMQHRFEAPVEDHLDFLAVLEPQAVLTFLKVEEV